MSKLILQAQNAVITNINNIKVLIENPEKGLPVKYEIEEETGALIVDRFLETSMYYPTNYGQILGTLGGDGDALDVLAIAPYPLEIGSFIQCRPIGVLYMSDEKGEDIKIIGVPADHLTPLYHSIKSIEDIKKFKPGLLERIHHFFEHYKDLDTGKWVKIDNHWGNAQAAREQISSGIERYNLQKRKK